jgi:integrase
VEPVASEVCLPVLGQIDVNDIDTALVLKVIEPLWADKTETASRLRGRIEAIMGWRKVRVSRRSWAGGPCANFATVRSPIRPRWKDHLDKVLPARAKVAPTEHRASLPYQDVPAFKATLQGQQGVAARALCFAVLCAVRTGEVIGDRWSEIGLAAATWKVPAERMKARALHRVRCRHR